MLNIPEEIKALYRQPNSSFDTWRTIKMRFYDKDINFLYPGDDVWPSDDLFPVDDTPIYTIDGTQVPDDNLTLTQVLCSTDSLTFGQCGSAMIEVTVADVLPDLTEKWFTLSIEAGGYEMMLGIYKVQNFERQADRNKKKIVAYDRMLNFAVDVSGWYQGLTFPMTLKQFRDSLCEYAGVQQKEVTLPLDDLQVTKTIDPSKLSGRDVMKAICEINGCFGQIDITGRFKYVFLGASGLYPSEELYPTDDLFPSELEGETLSHFKESTYEDFLVYGIDKVQIRQEEGDVGASYGAGTNAYTIQGNFLVYGKKAEDLLNIAATVHDQISGKIYRPCKIVTQALPWVEPGDGIICYTSDDVIETYCLKRTIKGIQAMMDTFEAAGTRERKESFGIATQIIQLEGKTAIIKKSVEEVSVRVTDLKEYTEAQFAVTAEQILAEVTRATQAEASLKIRADEIDLSVKNLKEYTEGQFKVTAEQILAKVSKGDVSAQLSVESEKVTISGNRLIVNSNNFQLDGNGNATFSGRVQGAEIYASGIYGSYIYGSTIESDVMKASNTYVEFGDYRVTVNNTGAMVSKDGSIQFWTKGPGWDIPVIFVGGESGTFMTPQAVNSKYLNADTDINIEALATETGWGISWKSVKKNIIALWTEVENIKNML